MFCFCFCFFKETAKLFPTCFHRFLFPPAVKSSSVSAFLSTLGMAIFSFCHFSYSNRCFLMIFLYVLIYIHFLGEVFVQNFAISLLGCLFSYYQVQTILYVSWKCLLSDTLFPNISFQEVACLFILLTMPFKKQKFFILLKFNLSIIYLMDFAFSVLCKKSWVNLKLQRFPNFLLEAFKKNYFSPGQPCLSISLQMQNIFPELPLANLPLHLIGHEAILTCK